MDLKFVGYADCKCKGVDRGAMDSFFSTLVPFADCSDKDGVSKLFCPASRYDIASAVVGG